MTKQELKNAIIKEKKERGICILAHTYQDPDIIDIADISGDSYALSVAATKVPEKTVLMCGVRFMAETVKMLSPEKTVILSNKNAGCPMAEQLTVQEILDYKAKNPDHMVVAYINTTAELKTVSDVCVTSSSALRIVNKLPAKDIVFIPDKNLGDYVRKQIPDKNVHTLEGCCPIHHQILPEDVLEEKQKHRAAKVAAHPECRPEVLAHADFIGSTSAIIDFCKNSGEDVIVVTERGVVDFLSREYKDKNFYQVKAQRLTCPNMKKTTLQGIYEAITGKNPCIIEMDEELRLQAKKPIDMMLKYGE